MRSIRAAGLVAGLFATFLTAPVNARAENEKAPLQVAEIFAREPLVGRLPASIVWAPDGRKFLYTLPGGEPGPLDTHLFEVGAHRDRIFFRAAANGKGSRPAPEFVWSPDSRKLAYLDAGSLWVIDANGTNRRRLAPDADDPQWSPDSSRVAYIHAGDIFAVSANGSARVRFSADGAPDTVNGDPDWVYSEELEMRHAYSWSPDGRRIAYLRFDQRPIAPFPIVDFLPPSNTVEEQRYPLAGGRNSIVTLRVASAGGAGRDLYTTRVADDYLASVGWTPSGLAAATILDRAQRHLRYLAFGSGAPRELLTERDPKWVDFRGAPTWLRDRHRFLFLSDRGGQTALYVADVRSNTVKRLTHGYAVSSLAGVDETLHVALVAAAYRSRRDSTMLVVPLGGGIARPLAEGPGAHDFFVAPNARSFVREDSAFGVPPVFTVGSTLGGGLAPFARGAALAGHDFGPYELFTVDSPHGKLDAWMIKPPHFNPAKRYPVVTYVYGGPAAPTTENRWGSALYLFHQALAQRGFIVFSIDGPGSQIDSAAKVRRLYHMLGPEALAGQTLGNAFLRSLPYVDPERIGIWGWSFGGYATTFAMTHAPGRWRAGIAVAPVTDWVNYDTIYTERYMGTPRSNPSAYKRSSALEGAAKFSGRLLVAQGSSDDNVHLANSVALLQALVLAGKQVDFMIYPRKRHGIDGIAQRRHLFTHMLDYWQEHL